MVGDIANRDKLLRATLCTSWSMFRRKPPRANRLIVDGYAKEGLQPPDSIVLGPENSPSFTNTLSAHLA